MPLLALGEATGVLPDQSRDVDEAIALMEELRQEIGDDGAAGEERGEAVGDAPAGEAAGRLRRRRR